MENLTHYENDNYSDADPDEQSLSKDAYRQATTISDWPSDEQVLPEEKESVTYKVFLGLVDLVIISLPLLFIGLAIAASRLNLESVDNQDNYGQMIKRATQFGPTLYPVVFAAVAAKSLAAIARHRSGHGADLCTLEQLMASHTLFSTIESQLFLRHSPTSQQNVMYSSTNQTSWYFISGEILSFTTFIHSLYITSFMNINQTAPYDTWGNLRIPKFESLSSKSDADGWKSIDWTNVAFSSLIGLPLVNTGTTPKTFLDFTIQSSYFKWETLSIRSGLPNATRESGSEANTSFALFVNKNSRPFEDDRLPQVVGYRSSYSMRSSDYTIASFSLTLTRVESRVSCHVGACRVKAMRLSRDDNRPNDTFVGASASALTKVFGIFPYADARLIDPTIMQPTENYILSSNYIPSDNDSSRLRSITPSNFADRLGLLFNTFYVASTNPLDLVGNLQQSLSGYKLDTQIEDGVRYFKVNNTLMRETTATLTTVRSVYITNKIWVFLLLVSSITLLLLGLLGLVAKYKSTAPEILGFVSSMTRDNRFFNIKPLDSVPGSALDDWERARLLKKVKVQIADVEGEGPIGRIAFVPVRETVLEAVRRRRFYQ
ncbi:MAG: hypothetical protein M1814_002328 [Vezdaea aestivalis]|nr:MAG: hypothetical protein M1814_002328 [Vezdaea aestivalis]